MTQKSIREEFQAFVDSGVWQGEDEFTKNFPVGNIADWFLSKIREKVEGMKVPPVAVKVSDPKNEVVDIRYSGVSLKDRDAHNAALDAVLSELK